MYCSVLLRRDDRQKKKRNGHSKYKLVWIPIHVKMLYIDKLSYVLIPGNFQQKSILVNF